MLKHLLLDLDGTLIDSSPGIFYSFCLACERLALHPPSISEFSMLIGPPVQYIARSLYPCLDDVSLEYFRIVFRDDYDQFSFRKAKWYPDVLDTLIFLSECWGIEFTIVTNKPTEPADKLVKDLNSRNIFSRVVGIDYQYIQEAGPVFGCKAEALSYVLASNSFELSQCAYLGDTISDRDACETCNLLFIAALYGFHEWLPSERPCWCIEQFRDIPLIIRSVSDLG